MMSKDQDLVWFVTGCTSGFGEQFVKDLLDRGQKVIATGRNATTRLEHLEARGAAILDLDVSSGAKTITSVIDKALTVYGRIDVVINNAGSVESASVEELGDARLRRSFETNFFGPASVARAVLPHMRERGTGTIAFVGSVANITTYPSSAGYTAAKHAQAGLVGTLAQEMAMFGLKCIIFEPGYSRTNAFKQGSNMIHEEGFIPAYEPFNRAVLESEVKMYGNEPNDAVKVVSRMVDVLAGVGVAAGKMMPVHVPVGADAFRVLRERAEADLRVCEEWEKSMGDTDVAPF